MFPRTFLEEPHRDTAAGGEVGMLSSFWVPGLLTLEQGRFSLETHVSRAGLILLKSFDSGGCDRERAGFAWCLKGALLIGARTRARPGCHLTWEQNVGGPEKLSYQNKYYLNAT